MTDRIPISYGEFYDFPRMIRFQFGKEWYFLRSFSPKGARFDSPVRSMATAERSTGFGMKKP